jgi:ParB/RepB/Spo0J family partition protein
MSKAKKLGARIRGDTALRAAIVAEVGNNVHAGEGDLHTLQISAVALSGKNPRQFQAVRDVIFSLVKQAREALGLESDGLADDVLMAEYQRRIERLPDENLRERAERVWLLARSIRAQGLKQPITVTTTPSRSPQDPVHYEVEAGERRYLAHVLLGRPTIRALVRTSTGDDIDALQHRLVENLVREDLTLAEELAALEELIRLQKERDPSMDVTSITLHDQIHKSERHCRRLLSYLRNEELYARIQAGEVTSVRQAEQALAEAKTSSKPKAEERATRTGRKRQSVNLRRIENPRVVRRIIEACMGGHELEQQFGSVDWGDMDAVQSVWDAFLRTISGEGS